MGDPGGLNGDRPRRVADSESRRLHLFEQETRDRTSAVDLPNTGGASAESELAGLAVDIRNVIHHVPIFNAEFHRVPSFDPGQKVVARNRRRRPTVLFRRSLIGPVSGKFTVNEAYGWRIIVRRHAFDLRHFVHERPVNTSGVEMIVVVSEAEMIEQRRTEGVIPGGPSDQYPLVVELAGAQLRGQRGIAHGKIVALINGRHDVILIAQVLIEPQIKDVGVAADSSRLRRGKLIVSYRG